MSAAQHQVPDHQADEPAGPNNHHHHHPPPPTHLQRVHHLVRHFPAWHRLSTITSPEETRKKLKDFWSSVNLVSALLVTVTYTSAVSPVRSESKDDDMMTAELLAALCGGLSLVLSLILVIYGVMYALEIDYCTTERDVHNFIEKNAHLFDLYLGIFTASILFLLGHVLAAVYITHDSYKISFWIIAGCTVGGVALAAVLVTFVAGHNRYLLHHYSTRMTNHHDHRSHIHKSQHHLREPLLEHGSA